MISSSSAYKTQLDTTSLSPKSKIIVDGVEYLGDVIKEVPKIKHSSTKFIGTFPVKTVNFSIYDFNNEIDFENKEIEVYKGIVVNNSIEYLKQGIFIPRASDIKTNISERTISFTNVQDRTQLLETAYTSQLDWNNNQTHTGLEIIQEICTRKNITLKNTDFAFANYDFKQPNFSETITDRGVIAAMAEIGGEIAIFDSNGELEIKSKYNTNHTIQRKKYEKLSYEKLITINTVVLGRNGINNDIVYPETIETERVEAKILDNPFVDLYREEMIEDVAEHIIGLSYTPFQIDGFVDGYMYELNDSMTIIDKNNNTFEAIILDLENASRIKSKISAPKQDNIKTEYNLAGSNKESINQVKLDVDHINQEITALAEDVSENTRDIATVTQNANQIRQEVNRTEQRVEDLADSIELFSVDLTQENLVISTDKNSKPYNNATYNINYYGYFKGTQITPSVSISGSQTGVTASSDSTKLMFTVSNSTAIANKTFTYDVAFSYTDTDTGTSYSVLKKVMVTLALQGETGPAGQNGADGTSTYFYVRYSKNASGNPMVVTPTSETEYMGVATTTSPTAPTSYSAYTWSKTKGAQGIQGPSGEDGTSSYLHIKWSEDGETFTPAEDGVPEGKTPARWQGTYVDTNPTDSTVFSDYDWVDTSIYVQEELNGLQNEINQSNANISDIRTDLHNNYSTTEEINAIQSHNEESINQLKEEYATLQQTSNQFQIQIGSILSNGVNKITTATGYTFDENGLNISKTGTEISNTLDNTGMYVRRNDEEMLGADTTGVRGINFWAKKYLRIGTNSRLEDYKTTRTGCFYVGGDN